MAEQSFYQKRNIKNLERIEALKEELPPFVDEYFLGIENQTRVHYGMPLRVMIYDSLGYLKEYREIACIQSSAL